MRNSWQVTQQSFRITLEVTESQESFHSFHLNLWESISSAHRPMSWDDSSPVPTITSQRQGSRWHTPELGDFFTKELTLLEGLHHQEVAQKSTNTVDGRNPANQLIGSLSRYLRVFIHPRWCRISSTNSITQMLKVKDIDSRKWEVEQNVCIIVLFQSVGWFGWWWWGYW